MHTPNFETFTRLAKEGNLIPVYREILADTETPVTALMKLADRPHLFLLESVEGGEKWGRYSFLGADLLAIFRVRGNEIVIEENGTVQRRPHGGDPLRFLKELSAVTDPSLWRVCRGFPEALSGFSATTWSATSKSSQRVPPGAFRPTMPSL